ncbi:MAG: hypothetical protein EOO38_29385, partial [Cytophagaceae bacterium]
MGNHQVNLSITSGNGVASSAWNLNVTEPNVAIVKYGYPGQTWNSVTKEFEGAPSFIYRNQPVILQLKALAQGGLTPRLESIPVLSLSDFTAGLIVDTVPTFTLINGEATAQVTARFTNAPAYIGVQSNGIGLSTWLSNLTAYSINPASMIHAWTSDTLNFAVGECQPTLIFGSTPNYSTSVFQTTQNINLTTSSGMQFFNDADCATPVASTVINAGSSAKLSYLRAPSNAAQQWSMSATATGGFGGSNMYPAAKTTVSLGEPQSFTLSGSRNALTMDRYSCHAFAVGIADSNLLSVKPLSLARVRISEGAGAGLFFDNPDCTPGTGQTGIELNID